MAQFTQVHDEDYTQQIKSHYHLFEWEHSPQWWYDVFYHTYQEDYNNNAEVLIPIEAVERQKVRTTEREKKFVDTIMEQYSYKYIDMALDLPYLIEGRIIEQLKQEFNEELDKYRNSRTANCQENANLIQQKYEQEILCNIEIIKQSLVESKKKREQYINYEEQLTKLIDQVKKLNRATNVINALKYN